MFLVGIFQWWYGVGWLRHVRLTYLGILRTADFFSLSLLMRTLFNPFRQISAGQVEGPLPVQMRAAFDRLFSRIIGAIVRLIMMMVGLIVIALRSLWAISSIVLWLILPILPIVGVVLWRVGVAI